MNAPAIAEATEIDVHIEDAHLDAVGTSSALPPVQSIPPRT